MKHKNKEFLGKSELVKAKVNRFYLHLYYIYILFLFPIRLWSTGTMISWCVFRKERRRTEDGLTGLMETSSIWYDSAFLILIAFYNPVNVCDQHCVISYADLKYFVDAFTYRII